MAVVALAAGAAACQPSTTSAPAPSANAWAVVNGHEIKQDDVEKVYRRQAPVSPAPSDEEALTAKLNILNDMIVQELLLAKARELKIEVPQSELDSAYTEARKNVPEDQFQKELTDRKLTVDDMRESLRRDLLVQKLFESQVNPKTAVSDAEISAFFEANKAQFNRTEDSYHIAQIVITPDADPQVNNRRGDDATTPQEAAAKAQLIMARLKSGTAFGDLAADFSEDPQTAPRGGDLGFVPVSALRQAPPALRDAVLNSQPGTAKLVSMQGNHTIVLVVGREGAGQKDLSMPEVKDAITQTLRGRKEQLQRTAFLSEIHNGATVVNVLAKKVTEAGGKMPTLGPTAPGK